MKQVDTKAYMTALRSLTEQGHSVSVPVSGSSMSPFLAGGPCSFPGRTRPCAAATSCFTSARAASLSCIESAAYTVTVASTSLAMRRPRPRPASCRSRSLRGRPPSAERVGSFSPEIFCGSSFAGRGCGSFRCGIPLSGYGACSKSAGHNTITIQNYRLRKEKRSGFHFAFFILLGFRGCPARGALRRTHGRPA